MEIARDLNNSGDEDCAEEFSANLQQLASLKRRPSRPKRFKDGRGRPRKLYNMVEHEVNLICETNYLTVKEVMNGPLAKQWKEAMKLEFD